MSNQPHLLVNKEITYQRQRWDTVSKLLKNRCQDTNISFCHKNFKSSNLPQSDKVLFTWLFDGFDHKIFSQVCDYYKKLNKQVYFLVDSWVDENQFKSSNAKIFSRPTMFGLTALHQEIQSRPATKLYNCFIHRAESVRQSWFYFLFLRGLLTQGHVSYKLYHINNTLVGKELFEHIHNTHLSNIEHFNYAYEQLKQCVPFSNFVDRTDLSDLILDTKYSLVLDTHGPDDDQNFYFISEKVTRALQFPTQNLLFVPKGTIQKLHQSGIYIDPVLLELDHLPWIERQIKLLEILENDSYSTSVKDLNDQSRHNRDRLNMWLTQCTNLDFYDDIFDIISTD